MRTSTFASSSCWGDVRIITDFRPGLVILTKISVYNNSLLAALVSQVNAAS
jgi:hypothetical protein